jgi:hypothetical protein
VFIVGEILVLNEIEDFLEWGDVIILADDTDVLIDNGNLISC